VNEKYEKSERPDSFRNSMATALWLAVFVGLAISANAQRPNDWNTCDPGTPIAFRNDGLWGYATPSGVTIPPQFSFATPFSSGVATACTIKGCGLVDKRGKFITPLVDRSTSQFADRYLEGVGVLSRDGKWGYSDLSGRVVIPPIFEYAGDFNGGMARVRLNDRFFFIDHSGRRVTPEFDQTFDFSEGLAAIDLGGKEAYIHRDGSIALLPKYGGASGIDFSEGLVAIRSEDKVGFMNTKGEIVIKPVYDDAYPFSEGLAPVRSGDSWGYIDKKGKVVIPLQYPIAHMFNEGVASVQFPGSRKMGYIDHAGVLVSPKFDSAMPFCAGLAEVETFRWISATPDEFCRAEKRFGRYGLIDHSGNFVWREAVDHVWRIGSCG
jgi:hypothetical protein